MPNRRLSLPAPWAALLFLAILTAPAGAQQAPSPPWSGAPFQAAPADLLQSANAIERTKGYDATVLLRDVAVLIDEAGRVRQRSRTVFRVDTVTAVRSWASVSAGWDPWHQKQPEVRARVITVDGVEHLLDPKTLSDAPARQDSADVYSDRRVYRGPLPAMAVGAIVEEEVVFQDTEPVFPVGVVERIFVGARFPVLETRIVVEAPVGAKLKYELRLLPEAKLTRNDEGGVTRLVIEQGKMDPIEAMDTNLPPEAPDWPQIELSTVASWKALADVYRHLSEPQVRVGDVAQLVGETVNAKDSREEKIRKLTVRLHKDVRYTGIEFGELQIVPQTPAEVFKRRYGDCKDKATALVAMLRAANVPAYLALLRSGTGQDVTPALPGGNLFDHAIVFAPGKPDIWIDATDEYSAAGHLAIGDQGRYALLIREGATDLVRTPSTTGIDNLLVEKREYRLAEFGPALITEESESHGFIDRAYRSSYGTGRDPKQLQREFENYTKNVYLADGETKVEAGDGLDLSKPFVLRVEAHQARRGYTSLRDARAALFLSAIASRLPEYFRKSDEELKKEEERLEKPRPARTADFVLPAPFITEWRCKFLPPPGFKLRSLPEDRTQDFGPAKLVQHWEAANDGAVTGVIRFDTVKARYTPAEAEALRKAIVELRKANALIVAFDQEGYSLLTAGKAKEAFAAFDRLIKLHPAEALHHIQIASALLEAGLGESARKEAHEAVRLEPQSAAAHKNLGWVLQHDLIGRRFKKGFDLEGALAEYRAALDLDPDDKELRTDYAILLEHDASGERYSAQANLGEAIAQYRKLKEQKSDWEYLDANLSAALFWSARWHEVEDLVGSLPASEDNNAMLIAARTALQGSAAGIRRATELTSDEKSKAQALMTAARKLLLSRCYPEAADLFTAANTGDSGLETVAMVRKTKKYEDLPKPTDDAAGAVKTLLTYLLGPPTSDPKAAGMFTQEWKADGAEGPVELDDLKNFRLTIRYRAGSEFPNDVRGDIILSNIKLTAEGDDQLGYRVMLQMMELNGQSVYVVKAQNGYRIVPNNNAALARVVLEKVQAGDLKGARQWLDWAREESSVQAGEDPLAGSIFARVWRRGQNGDRTAIQVAAASLMLDHKQVEPLLPVLETAREQASTETEKANLDMILFDAYSTLQRWPEALAAMEDVLHSYPDSDTAFVGYCYAALHLKNWDAVARAAQRRLEKIPHDEPALMMLGQSAGAQGNFTQALELIKPGISNPKAGVELLNDYAWNGLFVSPPPADMVEIAQRAARVSENKNFAVVHTLAAVYAEIGRPAEARKLMLDMIDQMGMDEPNEPAWYVFGRIAEQYGQTEAALAAYERTREKDVKDNDDPFSNISAWMLAQRRSKLIKASLERESGK